MKEHTNSQNMSTINRPVKRAQRERAALKERYDECRTTPVARTKLARFEGNQRVVDWWAANRPAQSVPSQCRILNTWNPSIGHKMPENECTESFPATCNPELRGRRSNIVS